MTSKARKKEITQLEIPPVLLFQNQPSKRDASFLALTVCYKSKPRVVTAQGLPNLPTSAASAGAAWPSEPPSAALFPSLHHKRECFVQFIGKTSFPLCIGEASKRSFPYVEVFPSPFTP